MKAAGTIGEATRGLRPHVNGDGLLEPRFTRKGSRSKRLPAERFFRDIHGAEFVGSDAIVFGRVCIGAAGDQLSERQWSPVCANRVGRPRRAAGPRASTRPSTRA